MVEISVSIDSAYILAGSFVKMEDANIQNQRMFKRRSMEAEGGGGGGEVRRHHIVYYLNRNGRDEHPHLIRIHHLSKNGVRLRDIKRWLGELRGKDMPESFAWSYKRRYKTGYVWQDILDDDLLTPVSDNEYVLKGSEISSTNHNIDFSSIPMQKEQSSLQESARHSQRASSKQIENDLYSSISYTYSVSPKTTSSLEDSSPSFESETSASTDKNSNRFNQEANSPASETGALLKRETNKLEIINAKSISKTAASSDKPHHRKSHSSGILGKLITCGGVNTNDSVVMMTNKRYKPLLKSCSCDSAVGVRDSAKGKGENKECSQAHAAYRPLYGPKCSICGKTFRPEKLQSHMNSCKGMKAWAKGSNPAVSAAQNSSKTSTASRNEDSISAYLLTQ